MITLKRPENNEVVDTHTDLQNSFIDLIRKEGIDSALEWLAPRKCGIENSRPLKTLLEWESDGSFEYTVELSRFADFSSSESFVTRKTSLPVENLMIGEKYFWRVNGGEAFCFQTANNKFRFINIDGVLNVRDLGGINIKQGMLYRGSDLKAGTVMDITERGKESFSNLSIKTELNLAGEKQDLPKHSHAGESVAFVHMPYRPYDEIFLEEHLRGIVKIFDFLADENNYPIYFHCFGGADRTGMLAIYLRALLGESEDDVLTDYELTSLSTYAGGAAEGVTGFGFRSRTSDYFSEWLDSLVPYAPNGSLSERIIAFLLSAGVKKETLEKVASIIRKEK